MMRATTSYASAVDYIREEICPRLTLDGIQYLVGLSSQTQARIVAALTTRLGGHLYRDVTPGSAEWEKILAAELLDSLGIDPPCE